MSLLDNIRGIHSPAELAERDNARFREPRYEALPVPVARFMRQRAAALDRISYRDANMYVADCHVELQAARVGRAFDEQAIRDYAEGYARRAMEYRTLAGRVAFAQRCGLVLRFAKSTTPEGRLRRLADAVWWRRQLRRAWTRRAENAMREVGMVRRMVAPYASDTAVDHHGKRIRRQRDWIESGEVVNADTGELLPLAQCVDASPANPAIRRGELMVRARGFEEIAAFHKHAALFVTLTTPSRFHAELSYGGKNPAHARETVRQAQGWLCQQWARARAKFKRLSILCYGIRVAEPHHDGTPHWHLLLFVPAGQLEAVSFVLRGFWLSDSGDDPGAREHRVKIEQIDGAKGSAAGYLAKYVSKNIDGAGAIGSAEDGETGDDVGSGIHRVAAWASVHGIRQFQQIGGPAVAVYRELRRLREAHADVDIERARSAADRGSFSGFVAANGGISAGRKGAIQVARMGERRKLFEPAESAEENYYGEPKRPRIIGVKCASTIAITRPHRWRIQRKGPSCHASAASDHGVSRRGSSGSGSFSVLFSDLGPVAITVRGANSPDGWTNPHETSTAGPH